MVESDNTAVIELILFINKYGSLFRIHLQKNGISLGKKHFDILKDKLTNVVWILSIKQSDVYHQYWYDTSRINYAQIITRRSNLFADEAQLKHIFKLHDKLALK